MVRIAFTYTIDTGLLKSQIITNEGFRSLRLQSIGICFKKKEVDIQVSAVIVKNPNILGNAIFICLVDTIQKFNATIHSTLIEKMREMDPKPWSEWTMDDIPRFLGMKETGEYMALTLS